MIPTRKIGIGAFILGSVVAGGISVASLASAGAAPAAVTAAAVVDDSGTATTDTTATAADAPIGPHTANGITEEVLTGDTATSVQAAVVAAYPDATIVRMETDADGATYEAHITLADGSHATVELDAAFAVTGTATPRA